MDLGVTIMMIRPHRVYSWARLSRAIASYRVRHNKRCKVLVSQMSATVYYRLSADASLGYRRNGRSQSSPPAFSSNEIPFPISAGCYSAKLNLDAIALPACHQRQLRQYGAGLRVHHGVTGDVPLKVPKCTFSRANAMGRIVVGLLAFPCKGVIPKCPRLGIWRPTTALARCSLWKAVCADETIRF